MATYDERQEEGTRKKWWMGCCGGCLGLALCVAIAAGVWVWSLFRTHPVMAPETFVDSRAHAFAIMQVSPEDEGFLKLLKEQAQNPSSALDLTEEQKHQLREQAGQMRKNLRQMTPLQLVVLARYVGDEEPAPEGQPGEAENAAGPLAKTPNYQFSGVVSMKPYSGLVRLLVKGIISDFRNKGGRTEEYQGYDIGISPQGGCLAVARNNFMLATDKEQITRWIDAYEQGKKRDAEAKKGEEAPPAYRGPEALKTMYDRLTRTAPLLFATVNSHGEIEDALKAVQKIEPEGENKEQQEKLRKLAQVLAETDVTSSKVKRAGGMFQIKAGNTGALDLHFSCESDEFARGLLSQLEEVFRIATAESADTEVEGEVEGDRVHLTITNTNLRKTMEKWGEDQGTAGATDE